MRFDDVSLAAKLLLDGEVIAIPTDTVYGLVCLEGHAKAEQTIYRLKGRPLEKKLITLTLTPPPVPASLQPLAAKHWPGALTLIIEGQGYRIPDHPVVTQLLALTGPLWSTSANLSGQPPALTADEVPFDIPILCGGPPCGGTPSAIYSEAGQLR